MVPIGREGFTGLEVWEVPTIGCKIDHKDVLYTTGNITNIL